MVREGAINAHEYDDVRDEHGGHLQKDDGYVVVVLSSAQI